MSILTSASSSSVSRGYDYYKEHKVHDINQINDNEFEGYVDGSLKKTYYVKININHPRKSQCDCPHANGNITCKHMVALFFELFPDEAEDYNSWLTSDFDEEYDEYDYDDYYDDEYDDYNYLKNDTNFEKPLFFDIVLDKYVKSLSKEELQKLLKKELLKNEEDTYYNYLKNVYNKFLNNSDESLVYLEKLNKKVNEFTNINYYDYNYKKFDDILLTPYDKRMIDKIYEDNIYTKQVDNILLVPKLAVYSNFDWIATFYRNEKSSKKINDFIDELQNYFNSLKHYSIKSTIPKSNILINIFLLKKYPIEQLALSLLNNAKYLEYIEYVIKHTKDYKLLYKEFIKLIEKNHYKNKMYIPKVLAIFYYLSNYDDKKLEFNYNLYSFLCLGNIEYLRYLSFDLTKEQIIKIIEGKTKDINLLIKLYNYFNEDKKLYNLILNSNRKYMFLQYVELLKNNYSKELYDYFYNEFYLTLNIDKKREIYNKAAEYLGAILKLKDGEKLVNNIIEELKQSNFKKCKALFEEIDNIVKI